MKFKRAKWADMVGQRAVSLGLARPASLGCASQACYSVGSCRATSQNGWPYLMDTSSYQTDFKFLKGIKRMDWKKEQQIFQSSSGKDDIICFAWLVLFYFLEQFCFISFRVLAMISFHVSLNSMSFFLGCCVHDRNSCDF